MITPIVARKTSMPIRIAAGVATKNTCICGIRRESTPRPRLNRMPKAMNGAEICTARVKPRATACTAKAAASPVAGMPTGGIRA